MNARAAATYAAVTIAIAVAPVALSACKRKHVPVAAGALPELPYPTCAIDAGVTTLASGTMRSGPGMNEQDVVERFTVTRDGCHVVFSGRSEWRLMATDTEVIYDADLTPIRAWKRMTVPGSTRADGNAEIRRYELRGAEVSIKKRTPDGAVASELLKPGGRDAPEAGAKPKAVIGNGRAILTMWIKRAQLKPGEKVRELVLDFRDMVERLENVTLKREPDQFEPAIGKNVHVYTIYGREAVYTDEDDVVIGDLAGLLPADRVSTPPPAPVSTFGGADPRGTP